MKLSRKQITKLRRRLDRIGQSDIRIGTCRGVAPGVKICRTAKTVYVRESQRAGSSRKMRRADADRGIRYI